MCINGVQYVEKMKGLVTYGENGELFLFDAAGQGKKLDGPTFNSYGVKYVEAMKGLVTYGCGGSGGGVLRWRLLWSAAVASSAAPAVAPVAVTPIQTSTPHRRRDWWSQPRR